MPNVDGNSVGSTYDVSASHNSGQWQDITLTGNFGTGSHDVAINFINHADSGAYYDPATGAVYINYEEEGLKRILVMPVVETRLHYFDRFMRNANTFLASPSIRGSCRINYLVPHLDLSLDLARKMAGAMNAPFVYPAVQNLYTFDGSHLWPESSERWSAEFVKEADPYIDSCLKQ